MLTRSLLLLDTLERCLSIFRQSVQRTCDSLMGYVNNQRARDGLMSAIKLKESPTAAIFNVKHGILPLPFESARFPDFQRRHR